MNNMDIMLLVLIALLIILHIHFCYRALTSHAKIDAYKRYIWGVLSLFMGPLGYYLYQNQLPLDFDD
ncbi:hypothetical protein EXU30_01515 [Shewanella maritima]|uniref:Uncharacterized protein n=1 Tax=Shewanella maritima TaxID=2520507 RepID=A0A411PDD3_9GAMM|nr:hypothetical protein EXU30_01515 [Shewanella maritima]